MAIAILKTKQIQQLESIAQRKGEISESHMISQAGFKVFQWTHEFCQAEKISNDKIWVICCGTGHNGADGLQCALYAAEFGYKIHVYHVPAKKSYSKETQTLLRQLKSMGIHTYPLERASQLKIPIHAGLVVDALLGSGLLSPAKTNYAKLFSKINALNIPVLSVDLPSGMPSEEQKDWPCIKATQTFQLGAGKISCFFFPGLHFCGEIKTSSLCFSPWLKEVETPVLKCELLEEKDVARHYQPPQKEGHKYQKGKVTIIAGSKGMHGAALLAAEAALSAGAGMVRLIVPPNLANIVQKRIKEVINVELSEIPSLNGNHFHPEHLPQMEQWIKWCDSLILGPGISKEYGPQELVRKILKKHAKTVVLDGDGIFALEGIKSKGSIKAKVTATPHSGEFQNIGGMYQTQAPWELVKNAIHIAKKFNIHLILKGPTTMYSSPMGQVRILPRGSSGLATAGSGDVLAGALGTLLCHFPVEKACAMAVSLHSAASILEEKKVSSRGIKASRLSAHFGQVYQNWEKIRQA